MRLVYLDEGGTSSHEPFTVVAGVMIDADRQMVAIEDHLLTLKRKHIPESDQDGFVFHATNIFSGTKYFRDREAWTKDRRFAILDDLVAIPNKFEIPITLGFVEKARFPFEPLTRTVTQAELNVGAHAIAFAAATMHVEQAMREVWPDEVAMLIAEDVDNARVAIKEAHQMYRSPEHLARNQIELSHFPLQKIRDTVHFAKKAECAHLQIADTCAFALRGHLCDHPLNPRFYEPLKPWMLVHPKLRSPVSEFTGESIG